MKIQSKPKTKFRETSQPIKIGKPFEIILNIKYGGWGLSYDAFKWLVKNTDINFEIQVTHKRKVFHSWTRDKNKETDVIVYLDTGIMEEYIKSANYRPYLKRFLSDSLCWIIDQDILRTHPDIIRCLKEIGPKKASGSHAALEVQTTYFNIEINDFDGLESLY